MTTVFLARRSWLRPSPADGLGAAFQGVGAGPVFSQGLGVIHSEVEAPVNSCAAKVRIHSVALVQSMPWWCCPWKWARVATSVVWRPRLLMR